MRVSSVCAQVPMFGVSGEFRYGIAVAPHRRPLDRRLPAAGPEHDDVCTSRAGPRVSRIVCGSM